MVKYGSHRGVLILMQVQTPVLYKGISMHLATFDARQSNVTPWNTTRIQSPRARKAFVYTKQRKRG